MKGVLCNLLVCLAVWISLAGRSVTDRILAIVFPISAFVAAGFEHCVANMYLIPLGILLKSGIAPGAVPQAAALDWSDLTETRKSLQTFLDAIQDYEKKVEGWRQQAADLKENAPKWIDQASVALSIFLLWFGVSQFGLLLHGLNMRRGTDPLLGLRPTRVVVREDGVDKIS